MRRREFITLLGSAAAWPLTAQAQQQKGPIRLGFVPIGSPENAYDLSLVEAFRKACAKLA
jgi:putative tryptophan/tyrosine transport system substrate-binding protein